MTEPQPERKYREIVEEHGFAEELGKLIGNARRADEFVEGAKWVLSRYPEAGTPIGTKGLVYFLPIGDSTVADSVVLYYTFDEGRVYFLSIRKTQYPPKENEK